MEFPVPARRACDVNNRLGPCRFGVVPSAGGSATAINGTDRWISPAPDTAPDGDRCRGEVPAGCTSGVRDRGRRRWGTEAFNHESVDPVWGVVPICSDRLSRPAHLNTIAVPERCRRRRARRPPGDPSFPSKVRARTARVDRGDAVPVMGHVAPANQIDVVELHTPGVVDPTKPGRRLVLRGRRVGPARRTISYTEPNCITAATNGRAATQLGLRPVYTAGNAGKWRQPPADRCHRRAGPAPATAPGPRIRHMQPRCATRVARLQVTQLGRRPDKAARNQLPRAGLP